MAKGGSAASRLAIGPAHEVCHVPELISLFKKAEDLKIRRSVANLIELIVDPRDLEVSARKGTRPALKILEAVPLFLETA